MLHLGVTKTRPHMRSLDDVAEAVRARGGPRPEWLARAAGRVWPLTTGACALVTSERTDPRRYSVRLATDTGLTLLVSDVGAFPSRAKAIAFLEKWSARVAGESGRRHLDRGEERKGARDGTCALPACGLRESLRRPETA